MDDLVGNARAGNRRALARLISHVEDATPAGRQALSDIYPATGHAHILGITGAPGAGKSTLTDGLIAQARGDGLEVAVLAVDPTSPFTGGAILGDRVRMQSHIDDHGVYIRSLASRGQLGGISEATPRVIAVLDGAGFDLVIVETVGVGQAEVDIAANADTSVVVVNPGWGDSVQAAKAGLLEIGDVFVVNKADRPNVAEAVNDLRQMLMLGAPSEWEVPVVETVALDGSGLDDLWKAIGDHRDHLTTTGRLSAERNLRAEARLRSAIRAEIESQVATHTDDPAYLLALEAVRGRTMDPWSAALQILGASG
ncbi:MAG: methylmalonyl Co-A mutase-associated GTPase MeaB [Acidimicrobiia bacterium]|nr:methylmalonyl Co-A mutase-associated GTPase MeaB [Acidimicrobiia bacterium]